MSEAWYLLLHTISLRPYVFTFLLAYLLSASLSLGFRRTILYLPIGYTVAWASEWLSVHYGIPYGFYRYLPTTVGQELWIGGIPFMDSLSYVFLSYASFCASSLIQRVISPHAWFKNPPTWWQTFGGAYLMVLLDIIIDPISLRGDRWFLGKIYEYPDVGVYFGVPLSNFVGWLCVGMVLIRILQHLTPITSPPPTTSRGTSPHSLDYEPTATARQDLYVARNTRWGIILGGGLYGAVMLFNLAVTVFIEEWWILLNDVLFIALTTLIVLVLRIHRRHTH